MLFTKPSITSLFGETASEPLQSVSDKPWSAASASCSCHDYGMSLLSLQPTAQVCDRLCLHEARCHTPLYQQQLQEVAKLLLLPCARTTCACPGASPAWLRAQKQPGTAGHAAALGTAHWTNLCCCLNWDGTLLLQLGLKGTRAQTCLSFP